MSKPVHIRPLAPDDYAAVVRIFFCAVHEGTRASYSYPQRLAWGGESVDLDRWKARVADLHGFVAEIDGEPVGVLTVNPSGYVELAYVLPSATRMGVGRRLLDAAERWARDQGAKRLTTEASLVAQPFFSKNGWLVVEKEHVERRGVMLARYKMQKDLA